MRSYLNRTPSPTAEQVATALELISLNDAKAKSADPDTFVDTTFVEELAKAGVIDALYR